MVRQRLFSFLSVHKFSPLYPILMATISVPVLWAWPSAAQIAGDNTLGTPSQPVLEGNRTLIQGGTSQGGNLFHSFLDFNVAPGQQVYFANPNGIDTILSRVTGNNPSNIWGTLGVQGMADLFLLNPNGILFGPAARLDMAGSFTASTAHELTFEDGTEFSAAQPQQSLLTISTPRGIQYGERPNGNIINQGQLTLSPGSQLSLFGATVRHSGDLIVPGGRVELLGNAIEVVEQATIDVSSETGGGVILVGGDYQGQPTRPVASATTVGADTYLRADGIGASDGGQVIVWADGVTQFGGQILARGGVSTIDMGDIGGARATGGNGGFVEVSGETGLDYHGQVDASAPYGLAGTLLLDPTDITIANGAGINTPNVLFEASLEGISGDTNLLITATNNIVLQDLADNALDLQPGRGTISITADADRDGVGAFIMEDVAADEIRTFGRDIAIAAANLQLGAITTSTTPNQDAGQTLTTARLVGQAGGPALTSISGQLSSATDVDLYQIFIPGTAPFSATTVSADATVVSAAIPNTQLFLFDANGQGLYGNDNDINCNCRQSTLQPNSPLAPGIYYLGVASYGTEPVNAAGTLFPNSFETFDFTALKTPTGAGGSASLTNWVTPSAIEVGDYTISLTGVNGVASQVTEMPLTNSGAITLTATNGHLQSGQLTTAATNRGGNITLSATNGDLILTDTLNSLGGQDNGGTVSLQSSGDIQFLPGVSVLTRGQLGGDLFIQSGGTITVQGGVLSQQSTTSAITGAQGGGFRLQGQSLLLQDGAQLISETLGAASLKESQVDIQDDIVLSGLGTANLFNPFGFLGTQVASEAAGEGGTLKLNVGTLHVTDAAVVATRTFGRGNAGDLTIVGDEVLVSGAVEIEAATRFGQGETVFESELSTEAEREEEEVLFLGGFSNPFVFLPGEANAGDLRLEVGRLRVENGGEVSAGTHSLGDGGNFTVIADEVIVTGQMLGESSELGTETVPEFLAARPPEGNAGNLLIESDRLRVTDGGQIATGTLALGGDAGRLEINAREIEVAGGFVYQGNTVTSAILSEVLDAAAENVQGDTSRAFGGRGGPIVINADSLSLREGGRISASTTGNGPAGDVIVTVPRVNISQVFTPSIDLAPLTVPNDRTPVSSGIFALSDVQNQAAGNIQVVTDILRLSERAIISAATQGDQGNINITGGTVLMRNGSQITTNAGGNATGGNITLDLDLLVAVPLLGNSDITANAEVGSGGQIRINARAPILGFQVGDGDAFRAANLTPAERATNDITAFSRFNPILDVGTVAIEPPEVDPATGVLGLPTLVNPSDRIVTGCPAQRGNRFTVTGSGGVPADPRRGLRATAIAHDFRLSPEISSHDVLDGVLDASRDVSRTEGVTRSLRDEESPPAPLTEAQTWVKNVDGNIQLIAAAAAYSPTYSPTLVPTTCQL